jgi:hypothetical protein
VAPVVFLCPVCSGEQAGASFNSAAEPLLLMGRTSDWRCRLRKWSSWVFIVQGYTASTGSSVQPCVVAAGEDFLRNLFSSFPYLSGLLKDTIVL